METLPQQITNTIEIDKDVTPWISHSTLQLKHPTLRFHNEIIDFYKYIYPADSEHQYRMQACQRVKQFLQECIPTSTVETFGSYRTKLYLPNSDIDMVAVDQSMSDKQMYKAVSTELMKNQHRFENINLIANAKVPIIKFVETQSQLNFDLSFNKLDGIKQLDELNKALDVYPEMRYLLFIIKTILRQRDLHETYSGGIGSFLLFQMILAFLREQYNRFRKEIYSSKERRSEGIASVLLSEYILRFLEFFGQKFDFHRKRILMINGGAIVEKPILDDRFSLISPQDPDHDIGNSSYKFKDIANIFKNRYNFLTNYSFQQGESVLKYLLNPSSQKFTFLKPIV